MFRGLGFGLRGFRGFRVFRVLRGLWGVYRLSGFLRV